MAKNYFTVGVIAGTHGIRGELRVLARTDFPEKRFTKGSKLSIRREGEAPFQDLRVESARPHKNLWLVTFSGYDDINTVEQWRGCQLCVPEHELARLPEHTYYIHQLIGLTVHTEDDIFLGELVEVLQPGANDVYVVRGPLQKQDILIPAIPDVVQAVHLEEQRMVVRLLPGMLEGDEA